MKTLSASTTVYPASSARARSLFRNPDSRQDQCWFECGFALELKKWIGGRQCQIGSDVNLVAGDFATIDEMR